MKKMKCLLYQLLIILYSQIKGSNLKRMYVFFFFVIILIARVCGGVNEIKRKRNEKKKRIQLYYAFRTKNSIIVPT